MPEGRRRWNAKPFNQDNVDKVAQVVGVYALMTDSGYVNFVNDAANIRRSLRRHLTVGDIPAKRFRAWQADNRESARRKALQLIYEYQPYYNTDTW